MKNPDKATQWFRNGDHPLDYDVPDFFDPVGDVFITADHRRENQWEGAVVRYYRHPYVNGGTLCERCGQTMHHHGWIDGRRFQDAGDEGTTVCPGDWVTNDGRVLGIAHEDPVGVDTDDDEIESVQYYAARMAADNFALRAEVERLKVVIAELRAVPGQIEDEFDVVGMMDLDRVRERMDAIT